MRGRMSLSSRSPSPASPAHARFTRAGAVRAIALLVGLWALAAWLRFPTNAGDQTDSQSVLQDEHGGIRLPKPPGSSVYDEEEDADVHVMPIPPAQQHDDTRPSAITPFLLSAVAAPSAAAVHASSAAPAAAEPAHKSKAPAKQQPTKHTDRVAVIIENRPLENLVPMMLHFHSVLGPAWPIILYTTVTSEEALLLSAPLSRAVAEGVIEIRHLPREKAAFDSHRSVSLFLTDPWLWKDLAPYAKVFLFQADSIICSASWQRVDDFLEWDLIGAPIVHAFGRGFNGGLSLRSREVVLELVTRFSYENDSAVPGAPATMVFEDQWMYTRMMQMAEEGGMRLPDEATASRFAVETIWEEEPLGFHQPVRWQKDNMDRIMKYCPEAGMISGSVFFG
ncbi:Uu.00g060410.m01.CDS01 [Anthostomella pinea]|uniref:Uu.00g060410.m01.CDS01 n=1 Tax=Anthostomella pinea TaxID=933095 RepID=A0AAI8YK18_9PEZI|nr:Uu.00g060410.m01.CDS01 [Anthostomella pinea]